ERAGRSHPDHPAVAAGRRAAFSYGDLAGRAARLAGALRTLGLRDGDRVVIASRNSIHYPELFYAAWHAGLAALPANAKLHGAELGYILEHSGARVCLASSELAGAVAAHAPKTLERLIEVDGPEYRRGRPPGAAAGAARES